VPLDYEEYVPEDQVIPWLPSAITTVSSKPACCAIQFADVSHHLESNQPYILPSALTPCFWTTHALLWPWHPNLHSLPVIREINTTDVGACCDACVADPACMSWTVNPEQQLCHLRATSLEGNTGHCMEASLPHPLSPIPAVPC